MACAALLIALRAKSAKALHETFQIINFNYLVAKLTAAGKGRGAAGLTTFFPSPLAFFRHDFPLDLSVEVDYPGAPASSSLPIAALLSILSHFALFSHFPAFIIYVWCGDTSSEKLCLYVNAFICSGSKSTVIWLFGSQRREINLFRSLLFSLHSVFGIVIMRQ